MESKLRKKMLQKKMLQKKMKQQSTVIKWGGQMEGPFMFIDDPLCHHWIEI